MAVLNGEGYVIIKAFSDIARSVLVKTVTMPYTEKGGWTERWDEESFLHRTISLDTTNPSMSETEFITGWWGSWDLSWSSLSIEPSVWKDVVQLITGRKTSVSRTKYYLSIQPRSDFTESNRTFAVNYTGQGIEIQGNTGGTSAYGNKGLRLSFRTITTQNISIVSSSDIVYTFVTDDINLEFSRDT